MSTNTPLDYFSAENIAKASSPLSEIRVNESQVYWVTRRPTENGRQVIMHWDPKSKAIECLTPANFNVRSKVHEYGGGVYALSKQQLFFVNADQSIYAQSLLDPSNLECIYKSTDSVRFGDLCVTDDGCQLIMVREQNIKNIVINDLVSLSIAKNQLSVVAEGHDFYASPALNPSNTTLTFLAWSHPNMPWEITKQYTVDLNGDEASSPQATQRKEAAIYQPGYKPNGESFCISDESGFWNLYSPADHHTSLLPLKADCGYPMWVLGTNQVVFDAQNVGWLISGNPGHQTIISTTGVILPIKARDFYPSLAIDRKKHILYYIAMRYDYPDQLASINLNNHTVEAISTAFPATIPAEFFSKPETLTKVIDEQTVTAFYYAPLKNTQHSPPMIVNSHGGPNGAATQQCQLKIQFWTARGYAYLDVNYRGSTGYGRDYRLALAKKWGIADTYDCTTMALLCVEKGLADSNTLFIRGQSAGGLTALNACTQSNVFIGGTSCYGVSNLVTLAHDTHKFEAHYLNQLVGSFEEEAQTYTDRSPAFHMDKLNASLLFLQGSEDAVVPQSQTDELVKTLKSMRKKHSYIIFEKEGHGFRRAENIKQALETEWAFYESLLAKK